VGSLGLELLVLVYLSSGKMQRLLGVLSGMGNRCTVHPLNCVARLAFRECGTYVLLAGLIVTVHLVF
jgi:hypothetical protein